MGLLVDVSNYGAILPTPSRDSADVRSDTNVSRNRASPQGARAMVINVMATLQRTLRSDAISTSELGL